MVPCGGRRRLDVDVWYPTGGGITRDHHVEVDARTAHRTEAVVDSLRDTERSVAIDVQPVVTPRLAGDRGHLVLREGGRSDEHVAGPSLAEIAVADVDLRRLALHRDF